MPPHCYIAPNEIALNNGAYIVIFTPKNVFRGGGGGWGKGCLQSLSCRPSIAKYTKWRSNCFLQMSGSRVTSYIQQTPNRRYDMACWISAEIYTNVVMISAGVKCCSVIHVVWLIKKLDQDLINKARRVTSRVRCIYTYLSVGIFHRLSPENDTYILPC